MKKFDIIYKKEALKFLYKNDRLLKQKIEEKINNFFIFWDKNIDIKILEPKKENIFRLRLGKFRVLFIKEDEKFIILVLKVWSRWDIYK